MKTLARWTVCLALLLAPAGGVSAQGGIGGIIDFFHKLSGPVFVGAGVSGFVEDVGGAGVRLRLGAGYHVSIDEAEEVDPDDANITMLTLQPGVELALASLPFDFGLGVTLHRFGGDADAFWHASFPLLAQWRPRSGGRLVPRIGAAVHVFPAFDAADFAPLTVHVSRDDNEAVLRFFAGVDYALGR